MADLLFIVMIIAFFALMVAFVHLCERIVGTDDAVGSPAEADPGTGARDDIEPHTATPEEVLA